MKGECQVVIEADVEELDVHQETPTFASKTTRSWEEGRNDFIHIFRGNMALPKLWLWISGFQKCERIHFCWFKTSGLWHFVMAALGNGYSPCLGSGLWTSTLSGQVTQARWRTGWEHEYVSIFKVEYGSFLTDLQSMELGRKRSEREKVGHQALFIDNSIHFWFSISQVPLSLPNISLRVRSKQP